MKRNTPQTKRRSAKRPRSVRLDPETERRLTQLSETTGTPASAIIRAAIRTYCEQRLSDRLDVRLRDLIGSVRSGGGWSAANAKRDFTAALLAKDKRRRRIRRPA